MYDWPEIGEHTNQFWTNFATALQPYCDDLPDKLTRTDLHAQWQRDDLLLSQTCVYPLVTELPSSTVVVGTPTYDVEMSHSGLYASAVLVNKSDVRKSLASFKGSTLAYNSKDSQSGFNALKSLLVSEHLINTERPVFFTDTVATGSHRKSIDAVASGEAHICAVDPVSWALAQRYDRSAEKVQVLTTTAYAPALPLITSSAAIPARFDESQWQTTVKNAFEAAIDSQTKKHLLLKGITYIPKAQYLKLPISNLDMIT